MSRLYASINADASKTEASRRGHKSITTHTRGWNTGVEVHAHVDENDRDVFEVYRTGGSNGGLAPRLVARIIGDEVEHHYVEEREQRLARIEAVYPEAAAEARLA